MKKILIVYANYYKTLTQDLRREAESYLIKKKTKFESIEVPGVFEIPVVISRCQKKYDGFIALGCVIKGKTPHFEYICQSTFKAIMDLSIISKKPIGNGIITALNMSQAKTRSKKKISNNKVFKYGKGYEAAKAVTLVLINVPKK